MNIETHITFKDYLKFSYKASLPRLIIFSLLIFVFLGLNLYNTDFESKEILKLATLWFLMIFIFIIVRSYFKLKNAFYSNKKIQEKIIYSFNEEQFSNKGETFEGNYLWNSIYRIKENKEWFLIYQSKNTMNMIPKKNFTEKQIRELRNIILKNGIKSSLRKD